jgi:hypothetical protein
MMTLQPGHLPLCRSCRHWQPVLANQGHPTPCLQVRWMEEKHVGPTVTEPDGGPARCEGFKAKPPDNGLAPGDETTRLHPKP